MASNIVISFRGMYLIAGSALSTLPRALPVAKHRTQMGPPHFFGVDVQLPTMVVVSLCREVLGGKCPVTSASSLKEALVSRKKMVTRI